MDTKQKYIRTKENEVVIFPCTISHDEFKHWHPVSAGFCYVNPKSESVDCFGESISLNLKSDESDTKYATKQVFGVDAILKYL